MVFFWDEKECENMATRTYLINNIKSGVCCEKIQHSINKIDGLTANVDLDTKSVTVNSMTYINDDKVISTIKNLGYTVKEV